jgi:hypothetical protein
VYTIDCDVACTDANAVQGYLQGLVASGERVRLEEHFDVCDDCRGLLVGAAQALADDDDAASAAGVDAPLPCGARVGRYVVEEALASGASGVVYVAADPDLYRRVALKILRPGVADDGLLREAQALARVSHPNVVSVFDVGTHEDHVFLAMELVEGGDLRDWLSAARRRRREILELFLAAGRGLAAAHAAGLVHRDFKPANVLVGEDRRVRITDFGLALGPGGEERGALVGTPAYMAPEQQLGRPADPRSDQWGFCVALYEALYGHRPFAAPSLTELRRIVVAGAVRPEPRRSPVPRSLRRILLRGLQVEPGQRFPSMTALLSALARDRWRAARSMAIAALLLVAAAGGLVADATARARGERAAVAELVAAGGHVERAMALRYAAFAALAEPTALLPALREVAGSADGVDFGLGDTGVDARRHAELHDHLASADWSMWTRAGPIAVADYKGRLVYSSAAPDRFGGELTRLEAVARAYDGGSDLCAMLVRGDDPNVTASGLLAGPRAGVLALLARPAAGRPPRAVFAAALDGDRLLEDLAPPAGARVALRAHDGASQGAVPAAVVARAAAAAEPVTLDADGRRWLALARALPGPDGAEAIGSVVVARELGAAGLFRGARALCAGLAAASLLLLALGAARLRG